MKSAQHRGGAQMAGLTVVGLAAGAVAGAYAADLVPPRYRASATLEFVQASGTPPLSDSGRDARIDGIVEMARALAGDTPVRAERIGATALINLTAEDGTPARAAALSNSLAATLIARSLADRQETLAPPGPDALDTLVAAASSRADVAEARLASFRASLPVSDVALSDTLRASLGTARGDAAAASVRAAAARAHVIVSSGAVGQAGTTSLGQLRTQRAELVRRTADLANRFDAAYPPLASARIEVAALDQAIAAELSSLARSANADGSAASARASALGRTLTAIDRQRARAIEAEAELAGLQRAADQERDTVRAVTAKLVEQRTGLGLARAELRLAASAVPPARPTSPQPLLLALFSALALGLAGALVGWRFDRRRRLLSALLGSQ